MGFRGGDHYLVRSKMALLNKDMQGAEMEELLNRASHECIEMYQKLYKHDDAIRVAEEKSSP